MSQNYTHAQIAWWLLQSYAARSAGGITRDAVETRVRTVSKEKEL
jgi:hypothetical protein